MNSQSNLKTNFNLSFFVATLWNGLYVTLLIIVIPRKCEHFVRIVKRESHKIYMDRFSRFMFVDELPSRRRTINFPSNWHGKKK